MNRSEFLKWVAEVMGGDFVQSDWREGHVSVHTKQISHSCWESRDFCPLTSRDDFHALLVKIIQTEGDIALRFGKLLSEIPGKTALNALILTVSPIAADYIKGETTLCGLLDKARRKP